MSDSTRADAAGLIGCTACRQVCDDGSTACSRCGGRLHIRKRDSLHRTWAFLIAALIFYVPANTMPVMFTHVLHSSGESTILEGIVEFWTGGSWDIALIIFIASVGVPMSKFFVIATLLVATHVDSAWARVQRARMYRFVALIGYWSMLDVVVVALVSALLHFRALGTAEPRPGIVFFGLVVVLTMLSAESFDPRLIWDRKA